MKSIMEHGKADYCYLCGRMGYLEEHHIFGGPNRKHSEALGLKVHLCPECHRDTRKGVHGSEGQGKKLQLQQEAQKNFEARYSHEEFIRVFGKNYLG